MPSFNHKVENFSQLLGESYFTRNQALYSALLAIKNAFSLDETRNLQKLRKRRNNATWYFARTGNKARKILDVAQAVRKQFFQKAGKIAVALPFVFTGLAGQGNGEPLTPQELHQLALNTKPKHEIVLKKEEIPQNPVTTSPLFREAALEPEKKEAWEYASEHAKNNKSVGIAIYGHSKDASAKQIGEHLKAWLAERGIASHYYIAQKDKLGAMIGFYLKDSAYGPTGVKGMPKNLLDVVEHYPQAWPEESDHEDVTAVRLEPSS